MTWLLNVLGAAEFMPHSLCLTGDVTIISLYVIHDFLIFAAYMLIAVLNMKTRGALSGPGYIGFAFFIFLCGLTHFTDVLVLKWGIYRLDIVIRVATAWVSVIVAGYMIREYVKWRRTP